MPRFLRFLAIAALFSCASLTKSDAAPTDVALTASNRTVSGVMSRATRAFRAMGLIKPSASVVRARVLSPAMPQKRVQQRVQKRAQNTRVAAADGSLLFVYKGFTPGNQEVLSRFVSRAYPLMVARYGSPAPEQRASGGKTIEVVGNAGISAAYQPLLKADNAPRGDGGTIFFEYDNSIPNLPGFSDAENSRLKEQTNQFNFTRLILRAFQGPNNFSYDFARARYNDVYQAGLADAVALLVIYDSLSAGDKARFDPSNYGFAYLLHVYDVVNRPELEGAYIFPPTEDGNSLLPDFRLGMAQAAWLKVGIEHPAFFRDFNAAYYAQIAARQSATPQQLRAIAAQVVSEVEGLSFPDWARRQFALSNSVTTGTKIFPLIVPVETGAGSAQNPGFVGYVEAFSTDANGDDVRLAGFGSVDALDEKGANINNLSPELSASNLLNIKKVHGNSPDLDIGFANFAAPNRVKISLRLRFQGVQTTAFFPFIGTGGAASQTTIYGVSQNGENGDLSVQNPAGTETTTLSRGAFAGTKKYPSGPAVVTLLTLGGRVFRRNTAWLPAQSRGVAFVLDGAARNDSFTFKTASGASTTRMISLPIFPTQSNEAAILGIIAKDLKLARYRPNLAPGTLANGVLTFGIGADRHEIYPNISVPIAPGRGYWIGGGEITRTVQGSEPRADLPFEIALLGGWNQFGVPFNKSFSPDAIRVRYGSFAPVTYVEAIRQGLVAPGIWRWQGRGGYVRADGVAGATLPPFEGFYLYAIPNRGVSLVFRADATTAATTATGARTAQNITGWKVPLVASTNSARDASNHFGASAQVAAPKPPTGPPVVTLHFDSSGSAEADRSGAGAASGWADSFLPVLERQGVWKFAVEGTSISESVALSWGDLKSVPESVQLVLRDEKTGARLGLRASGSYKWESDGAARRFSILATQSARASLQIASAPSRGAEITLGLSLASRGRLEIQNLQGDTIRVLKTGDLPAKPVKFTWSGQTTTGQSAPRGRYRAVYLPALEGDKGAAQTFDWRP